MPVATSASHRYVSLTEIPSTSSSSLVVRGPVRDLPASALQLGDAAVGLRVLRIQDVDVHVVAGAPRGAVRDPPARVGPDAPGVARLAVGQQGDRSLREAVAVELEELVAALVLGEHEGAVAHGAEVAAAHPVGEEGQLRARPSRASSRVDLVRVAEPGRDQHLVALRVPARERGAPRLGVAQGILGDRGRDRRHPLDDQVLARLDRRRRRRRRGRRLRGPERGRSKMPTARAVRIFTIGLLAGRESPLDCGYAPAGGKFPVPPRAPDLRRRAPVPDRSRSSGRPGRSRRARSAGGTSPCGTRPRRRSRSSRRSGTPLKSTGTVAEVAAVVDLVRLVAQAPRNRRPRSCRRAAPTSSPGTMR